MKVLIAEDNRMWREMLKLRKVLKERLKIKKEEGG